MDILLVEDNPYDAEVILDALNSQHLTNRVICWQWYYRGRGVA